MVKRRLIKPERMLELFSRIEEQMYRYPAVDGASFRHAVERVVADASQEAGN